MVTLGRAIQQGGWSILALAVALVGIAITVITIAGLRDADATSARRRNLIMSLAANFVFLAQGLLAGLLAASLIGFLGMAIDAGEKGVFSKSVNLFLIAAIAAILWVGAKLWTDFLRQIALSDAEQQEEDQTFLKRQRETYLELQKKLKDNFSKRVSSASTISLLGRAALTTTAVSAGWVIIGSLAVASLVWVDATFTFDAYIDWGRFWGVFAGTLLLMGLQMVFTVVPYLWSTHYLRIEKPNFKQISKFIGGIIFSGPLGLIVPFAALISNFSNTNTVPWKLAALSLAIIGIPLLAVFLPKQYSWKTVAIQRAWSETTNRLEYLSKRQAALATPSTPVPKGDTADKTCVRMPDDSAERIIELLERLVETHTARSQITGLDLPHEAQPASYQKVSRKQKKRMNRRH